MDRSTQDSVGRTQKLESPFRYGFNSVIVSNGGTLMFQLAAALLTELYHKMVDSSRKTPGRNIPWISLSLFAFLSSITSGWSYGTYDMKLIAPISSINSGWSCDTCGTNLFSTTWITVPFTPSRRNWNCILFQHILYEEKYRRVFKAHFTLQLRACLYEAQANQQTQTLFYG